MNNKNSYEAYLKRVIEIVFSTEKREINEILNKRNKLSELNVQRLDNILFFLKDIKENLRERFSTFLFLGLVFAIDGVLQINNKNTKRDDFKNFFKNNLDKDEKIKLILSFTFEGKHLCLCDAIIYQLDKNKINGTNFGIMKDCLPTKIGEYDSFSSPCCCAEYLKNISQNKVNTHIDTLIDYLYEIRNSTVHRGFPTEFDLRNNIIEKQTIGAYLDSRRQKVVIFSAVNIDFYGIITKAIKKFLLRLPS